MRIAYFDCFSGASGDMLLGALIAAGWPASALQHNLALLDVSGFQLNSASIVKQGIAATQVTFDLPPQPHSRLLGELLDIVDGSRLSQAVKVDALRVLRRLGEAEAKVHGISEPIEDLRLHELGSLDTLFDIVGVVAGLRDLAIDSIVVSPINLGAGSVKTAHGRLPVPAPAVAELVKGLPVYGGDIADGELLTPTGAALLGVLASHFGPLPQLRVETVGCGAGQKDTTKPNILRVFVGESPSLSAGSPMGEFGGVGESLVDQSGDRVRMLETNIDDMSPELCGPLIEVLLTAGALDAYVTPVVMKKGRPGLVLSVLTSDELADAMQELVFRETTTFGIRSHNVDRVKLHRDHITVSTPYGPISVKLGRREGTIVTAAPEFEDCRKAARSNGVPLKEVFAAATYAFREHNRGN